SPFHGRQKPHERLASTEWKDGLTDWQVGRLARVFDRGFEFSPDQRYQTAGSLLHDLRELLDGQGSHSESDFSEFLRGLGEELLRTPKHQMHKAFTAVAQQVNDILNGALHEVGQHLSEFVSLMQFNALQTDVMLERNLSITSTKEPKSAILRLR